MARGFALDDTDEDKMAWEVAGRREWPVTDTARSLLTNVQSAADTGIPWGEIELDSLLDIAIGNR